MEIAIVGDLSEEQAIQLAATYLGSLPLREPHDPSLDPLREVAGFTGPVTQTIEVETITPRAHPILMWRSAPWRDVRGRRLMFMAARILERRIRKEIREGPRPDVFRRNVRASQPGLPGHERTIRGFHRRSGQGD